jgi:hypothetical protein
MENIGQTIVSQYGSSPTIIEMIERMNDAIDPGIETQEFYDFVWNIATAQGFGLDIWGRIVGVGRYLNLPSGLKYFGFSEADTSAYPFDDEPFYSGSEATNVFRLEDAAYRQLILFKALANITNTTASETNRLLQQLFSGSGTCYVIDLGGMAIRFVFEFVLTDVDIAIISNSGLMPRPAGVMATAIMAPTPMFGFAEAEDAYPFDDGTFFNQEWIYAAT